MKWIGQHIWDFISRFRSDVYLESVDSGTIASGGNLGLDSNNKIVKSASPSGTIDLTSEVTGTLPVGSGGTGATTLMDNAILTGTGTSAITAESTLFYTDGILTVSSSDSNEPGVYLTNSNTDSVSSLLRFAKSATGADGDDIGRIEFYADNDADEPMPFVNILSEIGTAADTDEAGKLSLQVAASNDSTSGLQQALTATGHGTSNTVNIGLGYGATSLTTIAGDLQVSGGNIIGTTDSDIQIDSDNDIILNVDNDNDSTNNTVVFKDNGTAGFTYNVGRAAMDMVSSASGYPLVEMNSTSDDANAAVLTFKKSRTDSSIQVGETSDALGKIEWKGYNDGTPALKSFAQIVSTIADPVTGAEAGDLTIKVASYDGVLTNGLQLLGDTNADGEVDVTIGAGVASTTAVAGNLTARGGNFNYGNDSLVIQSALTTKPVFTIENSNTDAEPPSLVLYKSADGTNNDILGAISFKGKDAGSGIHNFAQIIGSIKEAGAGTEAGKLDFKIAENDGTLTSGLILDGQASDDGEIDVEIGKGVGSTTTIAGDLTTNGEDVLFTSSTASHPVVEIKNTTNDGAGATLQFNNTHGGNDGVDGDYLGIISFLGMDDGTPTPTEYAKIFARVDDATSTEESGSLFLNVANHDGGMGQGLKLTGGTVNNEIDVEIALGASSTTTVAGDLNPAGRIRRTLAITPGSAAGEYDGDVVYTGTTAGMTAGNCYYYTATGQWAETNASATGTSTGLLAIALGAESDTHGMLLRGMVTTATVAGTQDEGAILHLRASNGALTTDQASSGQVNRIVGYCMENSNNRIYFDPDKSWVEIA